MLGCVSGYQPSAGAEALGISARDTCGAGYDGGANVAIIAAQLDTTTQVDGGWGLQFANISTPLQGTPLALVEDAGYVFHAPASTGLLPGFAVTKSVDGADAMTFAPTSSTPIAMSASLFAPVVTVTPDPSSSVFGVVTLPGSGTAGAPVLTRYPFDSNGYPGDLFALPMTDVQLLSSWSASSADGGPPGFLAGQSYAFIAVGNNDFTTVPQLVDAEGQPNVFVDGGTYDGRGLHIVSVKVPH